MSANIGVKIAFFFNHTAYESIDYGKVFWDKLIPYKEILLFCL